MKKTKGPGGYQYEVLLQDFPASIQAAIVAHYNNKDADPAAAGALIPLLPALAPEAALAALDRHLPFGTMTEAAMGRRGGPPSARPSAWSPETAVSEADLRDPRIRKILKVVREAEEIPRDWTKGKRRWIETVALRHGIAFQSVYRYLQRYEKKGIAGLRHSKSSAGRPRVWTPEAIEFWVGLCLKSEHRKMDRVDLYRDVLLIEANRRNWRIGGYESANWWYEQRVTPQLLAIQRGGARALDNVLPPILRDYSDLRPFEILVGDQHRFDFWVIDDDTGEVIRPEGYLWQDLRSRAIYGAALDRRYDAWLIGLALRLGIRIFGAFGSIYTDNGRPELSRYLTGILSALHSLDLAWERTTDIPTDTLDVDADDINPEVVVPGTHRKAIVKNAKAKMIEGTNARLEEILRSHFRLPGSVKRLCATPEEQEKDHREALALAARGKLLLFSEFALTLYRAIDYYNRERPHRGVLREWAWKPRPAAATPFDCLKACYMDGWRPRRLSEDACDLIFLARTQRIPSLGRITLKNELYEAEALMTLPKGTRVDLRYNPMAPAELYVFHQGKYLCTALPVEYSSMVDGELADRKIAEKRERRRRYMEEYRKLTSLAPDFREYSQVPALEKAVALIGQEKRRRAEEQREQNRPLTQEELDAHVATMEQGLPLPVKTPTALPGRPDYFVDDIARFEWIVAHLKAGGALESDDEAFKERHLAAMSPGQREYYEFVMNEYPG